MATEKIRYDIEAAVSGGSEVNALASSLEGLANTLEGDLKTQALASAAALRQLGEKQTAIDTFRRLKIEVEAAAGGLREAQTAAQQLGQKIGASEAPTRAQAGQLEKLRDSVRAAKTELQQKTAALDQSRGALQTYGVSATNLAGAERNVSAALAATRAEAGRLASGLQATGAASTAAAAVQARLADAAAAGAAAQGRFAQAAAAAAADQKRLAEASAAAAAEQKRLADAANAAAQTLKNAFGTLGVRSAQELQAEIAKIRAAMDTVRSSGTTTGAALNSAFAAGETRIKVLERELRAVNNQLTLGDRAATAFSGSLGQISAGNIVADGVGYLVEKVKALGTAFLDAIVGGDQLRRGLNAVYKDAGVTASQIDFLRRSSSESGVAFGGLASEFVKFSAAMNSANIPLDQSNNLFKALTAATASLGLGTEATAGSLNALGQMASKGVVSMEELRQQLGDRLPGAIGLVAEGLGITEGQLVTLVSSGQLATRDFIVPFTNALSKMSGEVDGLVPTWERFKGLLSETAQGIGDAGATAVLTGALKVLGGAVSAVALALSTLVEGIFLVGSGTVALAARLTGDAKAWDFYGEQVQKSTDRLNGQARAFKAMLDPASAAANAIAGNSVALTSNTAEAVKAINANESLGAAQKLAALSTALAGDATLDASAKIVQYNVAATELISQQVAQTDAFAKSAKATKEQGDTLLALAQLTGDQVQIQAASTNAAEAYSAALDQVAASQAAETAMLVAQKAELLASAKARGLDEVKIRTQTLELDKKIVASQAETDAANAAAAAQRAEILTRQLSAKTYRDNSALVEQYTAELEQAEKALMLVETAAAAGLATEAEAEAARKRVTVATVLLNDAEADRTRAMQALTASIRVNASLEQAGLTLQMAQLKAAEAKAVADGNDFAAGQSRIAQKELEIKITRLKVQAQIAEQNAVIAGIELAKAELSINDPLYKQKVAALDLSIKSAQAKILEAKAAGENVAALERELQALKNGGGRAGDVIAKSMRGAALATLGAGNAANTAAGGYDNMARSADRAAAAAQRAQSRRFGRPGEGSTQQGQESSFDPGRGSIFSRPGEDPVNGDGQTQAEFQRMQKLRGQSGAVDRSLQFKLREKLQAGSLGADDLDELQAVVASLRGNEQIDRSVDRLSPGAFSLSGAADRREWENTRALFEQAIAQLNANAAAPGQPAPGGERTVNVRLIDPRGATRVVRTDDAGADSILQTLQAARLAAGG